MDKILSRTELDASIKSFLTRKCSKYDVPIMPNQARNGIRSRLVQSQKLMQDCISNTEYIFK